MFSDKSYFQAAISWFILSTIFLTLPGTSFPSDNWLEVVSFDKWVHIGIFSVMAILLCWGVYKRKKPGEKIAGYFIIFGLICLAYGIAIEFIQKYFIPNRSFDYTDIIADGTGCLVGLFYSLKVYIKK